MRRHDPGGRQGRAVRRRPRHRRRGERRAARPLRGRGASRTGRATGGSASNTPSTCGRATTRGSRSWASSRRCSRTTPSTTAGGPRGGSARRRCASSVRLPVAARRRGRAGVRVGLAGRPARRAGRASTRPSTAGTLDGKHPDGWFPEQRITVAEAVEAYTLGQRVRRVPGEGPRVDPAGQVRRPGGPLARHPCPGRARPHRRSRSWTDGRGRKGRVRAEIASRLNSPEFSHSGS